MIRKKVASSEEIIRSCIKRIKEVDPKIHAVVYLSEEQALEQAKKADQAIALGKVDWSRQPLFGIPVSIKDNLDTIDVPSTCGALALKNNVPGDTPDMHPIDLIQSTVEWAIQALARTGSKVVKRRPSIYDRPHGATTSYSKSCRFWRTSSAVGKHLDCETNGGLAS